MNFKEIIFPKGKKVYLKITEVTNGKGLQTYIDDKSIINFSEPNKHQMRAFLIGALQTLGVEMYETEQERNIPDRKTPELVEKNIQRRV